MSGESKQIIKDFRQVVNMSAKQLTGWLETKESQQVGQKDDGDESIGHKSGQRIVKLLGQKSDFSEDDLAHMSRRVAGDFH
jgi:hypothetical protein